MKRSVLGIIAVFCLQLGFVAYTFIDQPIESFVAVNGVLYGPDAIKYETQTSDANGFSNADPLQAPDGSEEVEIAVLSVTGPKKQRSAESSLVSSYKAVKAPASRAVNRSPQFIASRPMPKAKPRTEYPQVTPFDRESKNYQISAHLAPPSRKRSIFSRSVSVLKKPYDWLKAVGSRIR